MAGSLQLREEAQEDILKSKRRNEPRDPKECRREYESAKVVGIQDPRGHDLEGKRQQRSGNGPTECN